MANLFLLLALASPPQVLLVVGHKYIVLGPEIAQTGLRAYASANFKAPAAWVLDTRGLLFKDKTLCQWPGGRYDPQQAPNMVLVDCEPGLPLLSTWGDGGTGTAVFYVEFVAERKDSFVIAYRGTRYFLPKSALPKTAKVIDGAAVQKAGD